MARIHLDYVSPAYRDLANARFFYNQAWPEFLHEGFRELVVRDATPPCSCARSAWGKTEKRRMGFLPNTTLCGVVEMMPRVEAHGPPCALPGVGWVGGGSHDAVLFKQQ